MNIRHNVRSAKGRWIPAADLKSAIATTTHNATRTNLPHEIQSIDDLTGESTIVRVNPGNVDRPVNGNQVFRSTSRGK